MRVLVTANFNAAFGGLQANVRAQMHAIRGAGGDAVLACDPGGFADSMEAEGFDVISGDLLTSDTHARCIAAAPFDIIHAHPFAARQLGLSIAAELSRPLLVTFHGKYTDSLGEYASSVSYVVAVSSAIRDRLLAEVDIAPQNVVVIPNGADTDLFRPAGPTSDTTADQRRRNVFLASRFDEDKAFIVDLIVETWQLQAQKRVFDIGWRVAGDGTEAHRLRTAAAELELAADEPLVEFLGWQPETVLADGYRSADLVVAPGRSVVDCMATGTPVIAVGSQGYVGPMTGETAMRGAYENFGGGGTKHESYRPGSMFADIDELIFDEAALADAAATGTALVDAGFRQDHVDRQLLALYQTLRAPSGRTMSALDYADVPAELPGLDFASLDAARSASSASWHYPPSPKRHLAANSAGALEVTITEDEGPFYLAAESTDFSRPPTSDQWRIGPNKKFRLAAELAAAEPTLHIDLWAVQYSGAKRLRSGSVRLSDGRTTLAITTGPDTDSVKAAIRFEGHGSATIRPLEISERVERWKPVVPARRPTSAAAADYVGENLVFILGAPRSGTTWLLRLLAEHPSISAATVDNLGLRVNDNETLETNAFNDSRGFTDPQLRRAFHRLSLDATQPVIVEKTPIHLLFVDRIRSVFPAAALVLINRHPLAVINSLLHVGRARDAWWRGAPADPDAAVRLWSDYDAAARRCRDVHRPVEIRYEDLMEDTESVLVSLLDQLDMDRSHVAGQILAAAGGKGVPMKGAFRDGSVDSWTRDLTRAEIAEIEHAGGERLRAAIEVYEGSA